MNPENLWINTVITLGASLFAVLIVLFFMMLDNKKMDLRDCVASADKFQLSYGMTFIILGLVLTLPILTGFVQVVDYKILYDELIYFEIPHLTPVFFVYLIFIVTSLIIGALLAINYIRNKSKF